LIFSKPSQPTLIRPLLIKPTISRSELVESESIVGNPTRYEAVITVEPEPQFQSKLNGRPTEVMADKVKIDVDGNKTFLTIDSFNESQTVLYTLYVNNSIESDEVLFKTKTLKNISIDKSMLRITDQNTGLELLNCSLYN